MRIIFTIICLFTLNMHGADRTVSYLDNNKKFEIIFEKSTDKDNSRFLWLKKAGRKTLLWKSNFATGSSIYPSKPSKDPYTFIEIVKADLKDDLVAVIFKFDNNKTGIPELLYGAEFTAQIAPKYQQFSFWEPKVLTDGCNYLLRTFTKANDEWHPYTSVFLRTLWSDTYFEDITDLKIEDKENISVVYKGLWEIYGNEIDPAFKAKSDLGNTVKKVRFDSDEKLLLTKHKESEVYVENAIWWCGFDEFDAENIHQRIHKAQVQRAIDLNIPIYKAVYVEKPTEDSDKLLSSTYETPLTPKLSDYLIHIK